MDAEISEKLASSFAVYAVQGDRTALEKAAADGDWAAALKNYGTQAAEQAKQLYGQAQPYLADPNVRNALIGAGAGGLVGLMQPKRKMRNALTYGLVGGLGGLGLTQFTNALGGGGANQAAGGAAAPAPAATAATEAKPLPSKLPYALDPERALAAQKELKANGLSPLNGAALGGAGAGITGAVAGFHGTRALAERRMMNKDWQRNGARHLYNIAQHKPEDGPLPPHVPHSPIAPDVRHQVTGKNGVPPLITIRNNKPAYSSGDANTVRDLVAGARRNAQPTANQRRWGNAAGGLGAVATSLAATLAGAKGGEALWNSLNRQNHPGAF